MGLSTSQFSQALAGDGGGSIVPHITNATQSVSSVGLQTKSTNNPAKTSNASFTPSEVTGTAGNSQYTSKQGAVLPSQAGESGGSRAGTGSRVSSQTQSGSREGSSFGSRQQAVQTKSSGKTGINETVTQGHDLWSDSGIASTQHNSRLQAVIRDLQENTGEAPADLVKAASNYLLGHPNATTSETIRSILNDKRGVGEVLTDVLVPTETTTTKVTKTPNSGKLTPSTYQQVLNNNTQTVTTQKPHSSSSNSNQEAKVKDIGQYQFGGGLRKKKKKKYGWEDVL